MSSRRSAFALVELLVAVAIIAILIGILIPTLGAARNRSRVLACAANLKSLGVATQQHLLDHDGELPQMQVDGAGDRVPIGHPEGRTVGPLFGGAIGRYPDGVGGAAPLSIDRYGAASRPLNPYAGVTSAPPDPDMPGGDTEQAESLRDEFVIDVFQSPTDRGLGIPHTDLGLADEFRDDVRSMYRLMGTSYILNDHALSGEGSGGEGQGAPMERPTLVPCRGGRMPPVRSPGKTWLLASYPIYNYDNDFDLRMNWYNRGVVEANVMFVDLHVKTTLRVPSSSEFDHLQGFPGGPQWTPGQPNPAGAVATNVTTEYTFLPEPNWFNMDEGQPCEE